MMVTVRAPAKINLGLRILDRRPDGYHGIRSVFCPVGLCDTLRFSPTSRRGSINLECLGNPSPSGPDNIAWRAAALFLRSTDADMGVDISLHKVIPSPGGLGGGSSDAAAVLLAMAFLSGRWKGLCELALQLGSDVPFFLGDGPALVEGRGEILTPVSVPAFHAVLVDSGEAVPTPWAYGLFDSEAGTAALTNTGAPCDVSGLKTAKWHEGKPYPANLRNDFFPLLSGRLPGIESVASALSCLTDDWGLSGSGPVLYGLFRTAAESEEAARVLRESFTRVYTAESLSTLGRRQMVKTQGFGPCIWGFESSRPSQSSVHRERI